MVIQFIKNLIFAKQCYGCSKTGTYICDECFLRYVKFNETQKCHVCGLDTNRGFVHKDCQDNTFLDGVLCVARYGSFLKKIIRDGKYSNVSESFEDLGKIMAQYFEYLKANIEKPDIDFVAFVPMHSGRRKTRGYNQSEILAKSFADSLNIPLLDLITRTRNTKTQVGMNKHAREVNLIEAFELTESSENIKGKNIILVDDVFTTGTTMNLCAKVLKQFGAEEVFGFAFARSREKVKILFS